MSVKQSVFLGVITLTFGVVAISTKVSAEGSNVTHIVASAWQSSDFHDPVNPGCSIGGNGSIAGGRIVMGASQRQPSPMSLIIRKQGWAIPTGTQVQIRATFPDSSTMDFVGRGIGQTVSIDLDASRLPAWVHSLTVNSAMQLIFAGTEPPWHLDLAGTSKVVNAMAECFVAHHIEGVAPPFSSGATVNADAAGAASATQPFGEILPTVANGTTSTAQPTTTSSTPENPASPIAPAITSGQALSESNQSPSTATVTPSQLATAASPAEAGLCKDDWRRCTDNSDLVNNYKGYWEIQSRCDDQANRSARYGTPKWPGFWSGSSFNRFSQGSDYV